MGPQYIFLITGVILGLQTVYINADGRLAYGDKCSVQSAIIRVFSNADVDESQKCNSDQGLICTGTCACPPTRVWNRGPLFGFFGGSMCIAGANSPCSKNDVCVPNARCGENIPLCFCDDGYHAHEMQCISSYGHNLSSGSTSLRVNWPTYCAVILIVAKILTN